MHKKKYSVVIPTYNHLEDCLKPCVESLKKSVDFTETEIIIVANGCYDDTKQYLQSLDDNFVILWIPNAVGYTKATNEGIKVSQGEYIILLNNDNIILHENNNNSWIKILHQPFTHDNNVGITGCMKDKHSSTGVEFVLFFCVMIPRNIIYEVGYLDEIFNPGFGEDIDYCARIKAANYKIVQVPDDSFYAAIEQHREIYFPIWHKSSQTVHGVDDWEMFVRRNENILCLRHNRNTTTDDANKKKELYNSILTIQQNINTNAEKRKKSIDVSNSGMESTGKNKEETVIPAENSSYPQRVKIQLSIILPVNNHLDDYLKPTITEIDKGLQENEFKLRIDEVEVLVVAHGCDENTINYINKLEHPYKLIYLKNRISLKKAIDEGKKYAQGLKTLIVKNDAHICQTRTSNLEIFDFYEPQLTRHILNDNQYNVHKSDIENKIVVDLGSNIGIFTDLCLNHGAKKVFAFDVDRHAINIFENIFGNHDRVCVKNKAVVGDISVKYRREEKGALSHLIGSEVNLVDTISLDDIIHSIDDTNIVVKISCEGQEYDLLYNTNVENLCKCSCIFVQNKTNIRDCSDGKNNSAYLLNYMRRIGFDLVFEKTIDNSEYLNADGTSNAHVYKFCKRNK